MPAKPRAQPAAALVDGPRFLLHAPVPSKAPQGACMARRCHGPNNENNSIAIKKMRLAVFDLDHTLMPLDTGDMWVRWLVARSGTDPRPVASELERFAREYRAGVIDIDDFESFQMRFLSQFRRDAALDCRACGLCRSRGRTGAAGGLAPFGRALHEHGRQDGALHGNL